MNSESIEFGRRYRRFLRVFTTVIARCPSLLRKPLATRLGRWLTPFNMRSARIREAMSAVVAPEHSWNAWRDWVDSHIEFTIDFLDYRHLDQNWLKSRVCFEDEATLASLKTTGGLVLTYHTHHQNTLCCALGLSGCPVSAIAAAPEDSALFPLIGKWARLVNETSARHFLGGEYFFTNDLRQLVHNTGNVLKNKQALICLADFNGRQKKVVAATLLDRTLSPPTGMIELTMRLHASIYLALAAPEHGRLVIRLRRLQPGLSLQEIVDQYVAFLEHSIRQHPACWQGWEWFPELSETTVR